MRSLAGPTSISRLRQAIEYLEQARELYSGSVTRPSTRISRRASRGAASLGEYGKRPRTTEALALYEQAGNQLGEARAFWRLGVVGATAETTTKP